MGELREAAYYDEMYLHNAEYKKHYKDSFYLPLWEAAAELIGYEECILELGCGVGQFAQFLLDNFDRFLKGKSDGCDYIGIDFSGEAIARARKTSRLTFKQEDINLIDFKEYSWIHAVVILETLEHLEDDLELLRKIKEKRIIITVPEFDDPAHVRFFPTQDDVINYYSQVLCINSIKKINRWYLIDADTYTL